MLSSSYRHRFDTRTVIIREPPMFCWHCGTKLPSVAAFCYRCGQSQAADAAFDPRAQGIAPDGWPWPNRPSTPQSDSAAAVDAPIAPTTTALKPPALPSAQPAAIEISELNPLVNILAIGCGLIVVAGSFGPWVTAHVRFLGSIEIRGSEVDGRITAWCGIAAVTCLLLLLVAPTKRSLLSTIAMLAFFVAAVIGASDWTSVSESLRELRESGDLGVLRAEIGWGLRAVTFGGAGGTLLAVLQYMHARALRRATNRER
jgi:hypothetical protein